MDSVFVCQGRAAYWCVRLHASESLGWFSLTLSSMCLPLSFCDIVVLAY